MTERVSEEGAVLRLTSALRQSEDTLRARDEELAKLRQVNAELQDARRAALNLMEDAVDGRRQVEELNRRLRVTASCDRLRATMADALRSLADPVQIQSVACRVLAEYLGADRVSYVDVLGDGKTSIIPPDFRYPDRASGGGQQTIGDVGTFMNELRAGLTIVLPHGGAEPSLTDAEQGAQRVAPIQVDSFIAVPLVKDGRLVAALCVTQGSARAWTPHAIELVQETAERTWAAVERARAEEALRHSEERLRRLNDDLEERIRERTSELVRANTSLQIEVRERRAAEGQIKALFKRLVSAQEEERRRIARDIHDQLGQQMTAVRMHLEALRLRTDADTPLAEYAQRTLRLAEELDRGIDFLTWELRPAALDHLGLPAALAHLVGGWAERFHVPADYEAIGVKGVRLPSDVEANLYRLTQEALHNVYKHARATHVNVLLERRDHRIVLVIEDNGCGFTLTDFSPEAPGSLGLVSMRERAALVGGELAIESTSGHGTTITVRVPIAAEAAGNGQGHEAASSSPMTTRVSGKDQPRTPP